jgi:ABC-type transport system involved in cytochrome c biogenesis permease subunit
MSRPTVMIHVSLVVILVGALASHLTATQGSIHLRRGDEPTRVFTDEDGTRLTLPFSLSLNEFAVDYYPGTRTPMDFVSSVAVSTGEVGTVSMNNVFEHNGYRFYQSAYDRDMEGTTLRVAHDTWGIAISYVGYLLMTLSMLAFMIKRRAIFKSVKALGVALLFFTPSIANAAENGVPKTVSAEVADALGDTYLYYNDRICPFETFARDFTLKITGATSYRGLSAVQVVAGWLFYYDDWKTEPMIEIKDKEIRQALGVEGAMASLTDFFSPVGFKLEGMEGDAAARANEKFNLISMVATGSALRIYPVNTSDWYSPADNLPSSVGQDEWIFIKKSLNLAAQYVYEGNMSGAAEVFTKIKKYQEKTVGTDILPSPARFNAEKAYNHRLSPKLFAIIVLVIGIACYLSAAVCRRRRWLVVTFVALASVAWVYLTATIVLRGYVAARLPLASGYEVMEFMAWCALTLAVVMVKRVGQLSLASGLLVTGFALLVGALGEANPAITPLMPVLASPLLSAHVMIIMLSYALLALIFINAFTALVIKRDDDSRQRLAAVSLATLYPALFMLSIGIFIGAVWANQSWGTFWSWDPKETWALITMLIYAVPLHRASLTVLARPRAFHLYTLLAFLAVLMTYFGVNYLLGGLHSYA